MNTVTILPYGSKVVVTSVDMNGYWGRDLHPEATDVGFLGVVVANLVALPGDVECRSNVLGGTEFSFDEETESVDVCYKVRAADGRELELMNHEIEAI